MYRPTDLARVLRIKQLVFVEGLTLAGARRRLEDSRDAAVVAAPVAIEAIEPVERPRAGASAIGGDARARIANVRQGLESILTLLSGSPATREDVPQVDEEYRLEAPAERKVVRKLPARRSAEPAAPVAKRKRASA